MTRNDIKRMGGMRMDNKMQVFQSEEFGDLRTIRIDGEPWFVGRDVAAALGYAKPENAMAAHVDPEDKTTTLIQGNGSNYKSKAIIINESGLYSLIFSSKLEAAKRFKRWVTAEVLPSIRKHGAYMTDALLEQAATNADVATQAVKALYEERNLNKKLAGQLQQSEARLTETLPKAAYYDALVACPDCTGVRLTAKLLGVSQSMFTSYLVRKKYAYYDVNGKMHPYALHYRNGLFVVREFIARNGHSDTQMLVTAQGRMRFNAERAEITG